MASFRVRGGGFDSTILPSGGGRLQGFLRKVIRRIPGGNRVVMDPVLILYPALFQNPIPGISHF